MKTCSCSFACKSLTALSTITAFLVACGDTNETTNIVEGGSLDLVADLDSLPECTTDNEGAYVWIKSENELRVCSEEEWAIVGSGGTCYTEPLADSSGMKLMCNGDSVGVVLNGKDGSDGKNGSDGKDLKDTAAADSEAVATSLDSITGYSQKGPFLKGTPVSVRGLENGRTLTQSNITYEGKIGSDDGEFKLRGGMLKSQYVSLTATGFYRNEVTGKNSESQITLNALTDLTTHTSANLNLLTHLEYDRVYHLVKNMGKRFASAKKQAQKEIFAAFHIDSKDFKSSEDLNIAGSSEADAALLAVSIMMQRDGSVSQLSDFITGFAANLEKDGTWDDESMRKVIADWAMNADLDGRLSDFRANVKSWKLSDSVPAFEKYVTRFWQTEFKLDGCTEANDGVVVAKGVPNNDDDKDRLICDAGAWRLATDFEKDTYGWEAGDAGERRLGKVNNDVYYVYDKGKWWRTAEGMEIHFGGCTVERDGELKTYNNNYYVCHKDSLKWASATTFEMDTYGWKPGKDGDVRNGSVNDAYVYVFDGNAWRRGSETDSTYGIGGCTAARKDTVAKSTNGSYYICRATGWEAATDFEKDTYGWKPGKDGDAKKGNVNTNSVYVFVGEKNAWRRGSDLEDILGLGCTSSKEGNIAQDSAEKKWYICRDRAWQSAKPIEYDTYGWELAKKDGAVSRGTYTDSVYVFHLSDNKWKEGTELDAILGTGCTEGEKSTRNGIVVKDTVISKIFYTCEDGNWRPSTDYEKDTREFITADNDGDVEEGAETHAPYVYEQTTQQWRAGNAYDTFGQRGCTIKRNGEIAELSDGLWYTCDSQSWRKSINIEEDTAGWDALDTNFVEGDVRNGKVNSNLVYVFDGNHWRHGTALDSIFKKLDPKRGRACAEKQNNIGANISKSGDLSKIPFNDNYYLCSKGDAENSDTTYRWLLAPDYINQTTGAVVACGQPGSESLIIYGRTNGLQYVCDSTDSRHYRLLTSSEIILNRICTSIDIGDTLRVNGELMTCAGAGNFISMEQWNWNIPAKAWMAISMGIKPVGYDYIFTDKRDGHEYYKKGFGAKEWMLQNLNYKIGTPDSSRCPHFSEAHCLSSGRFYSAITAQTVCPDGWHLPDTTEWKTLFASLSMSYIGGCANETAFNNNTNYCADTSALFLMSKYGWFYRKGKDNSEMSILPTGNYEELLDMWTADVTSTDAAAYFWTSTRAPSETIPGKYDYYYVKFIDTQNSNSRIFRIGKESAELREYHASSMNSVRCVKDR